MKHSLFRPSKTGEVHQDIFYMRRIGPDQVEYECLNPAYLSRVDSIIKEHQSVIPYVVKDCIEFIDGKENPSQPTIYFYLGRTFGLGSLKRYTQKPVKELHRAEIWFAPKVNDVKASAEEDGSDIIEESGYFP